MKTTYSYDPFGNVTVTGEASDNPFQYTGRENDNTGLYYYRARYYSPEVQRFISEDPIGLKGGINKFAYVGNNPILYNDPFGKEKGRYHICDLLPSSCENGCKKAVDVGCSWLPNYCCKVDYDNCIAKLDTNDPLFDKKSAQCWVDNMAFCTGMSIAK